MNLRGMIILAAAMAAAVLALTSCSAKKEAKIQIYSDAHYEEYTSAAKEHFSSVGWSKIEYMGEEQVYEKQSENGSVSVRIGLTDGTRYVVVIGADEAILGSAPAEGQRFTFNVFDDGAGDIKITALYKAGTTENCVVQGSIQSGEMAVEETADIAAAGVSDPAERAKLIFEAIYSILVRTEGK